MDGNRTLEMKREVVTFDGGINNLIAPHLINDNNSIYMSNCSIITGELISAKEPVEDDTKVIDGRYAHYYRSKDEIISSEEDRFYVEWAGFLYWSNSAGTMKRYDGTTISDLGGHVAPTGAPTVATDGAGLLKLDYSYCYTYLYDEVFESPPSDIVEILAVDNEKVKITFGDTPPTGPAPSHRIIYRSGGVNPTFNRVAEVPIGDTDYTDNTSDFKISRRELTTGTNDAPPENLDMLVESNGTLFGAVGDKVYFSKEGQPEYWSGYNYIQLPTACTGLGVLGANVIAFTEENMFAITGKDISTIAKYKLPFQYGCRDKRSLQNIKGRLIWATKLNEYDLLCSYDGGSVSIVNFTNRTVMSDTIGNFIYDHFSEEDYDSSGFTILNSAVMGRSYLLFLNGRTVIVDFESGTTKTYYMNETVLGAFEYHNELFIINKDSVFRAYRYLESYAPRRDLSYLTKDFSGGDLTLNKAYRKIHINGAGAWGIAVHVDNRQVFTFDSSQGDTIFLPAGITGKLISFSISSNGYAKIVSLAYEFDVLGDGYPTRS